jgi:general secretion pathway protein D
MEGKRMQTIVLLALVLTCVLPLRAAAESASAAFKAGERAEKKNEFDTAYQAYKRAHEAKPNDPRFAAAFLRTRFYASTEHVHSGQTAHDQGNLENALTEFRLASQIDPSNFEAIGQVRRTMEELKLNTRDKVAPATLKEDASLSWFAHNAAGPVELHFKADLPVSIQMTTTTDVLYKTIGKLGGLNVLMDPEFKPQKLTFELKDVTLRDALNMLAVQSKTFWRPLSSNTILVTADNGSKRKELEQSVMKTFYLRNASTPEDLQLAAGTLKGILDINHIQVTPELRSLTLRGTPDQMIFAQKLLTDIDKPKSEVIVEVMVMQVSRDKLRTFGAVLPTTVSAALAPIGSSSSSGAGSGLPISAFPGLGAGDVVVSLSGASFTALASDSTTKVIQRPEIRVMDSEKASLKIGDRIPIATGSFQGGLQAGVSTQFQYVDVGVNIDITPYIHADREVTLKMSLEISSVTGEQTIDGVTEPTIGQRRIEHQTRLADGEINLIGGILQDTETKSMSGYPLLSQIPILKYLFGQESKEHQETEIVFAVIPHILRLNPVTDEDVKMVDLGSPSSVTYRSQGSNSEPQRSLGSPSEASVPPTQQSTPAALNRGAAASPKPTSQ